MTNTKYRVKRECAREDCWEMTSGDPRAIFCSTTCRVTTYTRRKRQRIADAREALHAGDIERAKELLG